MKHFNFPKTHAQKHVVQDIKQKGALRYSTARPFEGHHRSFKECYQHQTNFKNIEPQVCFSSNFYHYIIVEYPEAP